jgi:hypothetical protein
MVRIECIARAAVVGIPCAVLLENVINTVSQPAEAQSGPSLVPFRSVIVDNVQYDLDICTVKRLNHVAKLIDRAEWILTRTAAMMRRKERDWCITPVVDQSGSVAAADLVR